MTPKCRLGIILPMTTRTDVHRPAALVTEDYEYVLSYDAHPGEGDRRQLIDYIERTGEAFGENHSAGGCFHCGQNIRYVAVLRHTPTGDLIKVGEQCLDNRFDLASADFHRLRKAAELNRARRRITNIRAEWFAVDQDRQVAFEWAAHQVETEGDYGYDGMRHNFVHSINRYGTTSDKFVRAIMRDMARTERIAAERAAEKAQGQPVVEGKITVEGQVLSVKWQENDYGSRQVMTVADDRGFKVWGSVPRSIDNVERGDRVRFNATVEASDRDETFGFYKRPTKAVTL